MLRFGLGKQAETAPLGQRCRQFLRKGMALASTLPWRPARLPWPVVATASICMLLMPLLPLIHQAMVLGLAVSLRAIAASTLLKQGLIQAGLDPVYASVFNRTLGNIEARGLAVAGPLGSALHQLAPDLFATPDKVVPGAWATALVVDGVSVLASAIATVGTDVIFVGWGLALLWVGLRRGWLPVRVQFLALTLVGVMLQARGLVGLFSPRFSLKDIEIMGLSHVFTKLFPVDGGSYQGIVADPLTTFVPFLIPFALISAIYGTPLAMVLVRARLQGGLDAVRSQMLGHTLNWPLRLARNTPAHTAAVTIALLAGLVLSQGLFPALADYNYPVETDQGPAQSVEGSLAQPAAEPAPAAVAQGQPPMVKAAPRTDPSKVDISGVNYAYAYTVDGQPQRIRGVGYNVMYSHLSLAERAAVYERDFGLMSSAGINTILGWEREQFDELTLEKAQDYGLGVVMPYSLPRDGDYGNPAFQQQVEQDAKEWVKRFKKYPALRMWGIGNEVIHSMGKNPDTPRARAFAQFYVKLADAVHGVDPDHPVTYRDAEDLYLGPLRDALKKDGVRRPWFVYGVNFFTMRICDALADWPKRGMDSPLMVSEFAPSGLSPEDRPKGYLKMLHCIAKQNSSLLGGFAYVWTTRGPEAIDRVMGLVDGEDRPVDKSLSALGKAYRHNLDANDEVFPSP